MAVRTEVGDGTTARRETSAAPRRRPKNRKAQIAAVAAQEFGRRGYHSVGVDDIAAEVGISGPALYRHFPNKYQLFLHVATTLATELETAVVDETAEVGSTEGDDAAERLERYLAAAIRTTLAQRRTAGLYRWESRYVQPADRGPIRDAVVAVHRAIRGALGELRPELTKDDLVLVCVATLGVIGSVTAHNASLPVRRTEALLLDMCDAVARTPLPPAPQRSRSDSAPPRGIRPSNKRELLLLEASRLFNARGYHDVGIEEIGAAAGINASGVYRHFTGKADLLAAMFHRAAERLAAALSGVLALASTPREALVELVDVYIRLAFAQSDLMGVYFVELGNLPAEQRAELRRIQRANVEEWARLLEEARPELSLAECRYVVHAALNLVLDAGRVTGYDLDPANEARVRALTLSTLFGTPFAPSPAE